MAMKIDTLMMVRVYLTESEHRARQLLELLHASKIGGATLIRGISGFGQSGRWHSADWSDLIGDLPLILEFADTADKVDEVLPQLLQQARPRHVFRFPIEMLSPD